MKTIVANKMKRFHLAKLYNLLVQFMWKRETLCNKENIINMYYKISITVHQISSSFWARHNMIVIFIEGLHILKMTHDNSVSFFLLYIYIHYIHAFLNIFSVFYSSPLLKAFDIYVSASDLYIILIKSHTDISEGVKKLSVSAEYSILAIWHPWHSYYSWH